MSIVGVLETQVRASTQDFERGMERASRSAKGFEQNIGKAAQGAARAFGNAMSAVAASQAAQEKSWATLAATVVSSFAIGGPVMGAVTAAGAAIGLLVSHFKESGRAAQEAAAEWEKEMKARGDSMRKMSAEMEDLRRKGLFFLLEGRGPTAAEGKLADLEDAALKARIVRDAARAAEIRQMLAGGYGDVSMGERRGATARAEEAVRVAEELVAQQRAIVDEQARQQAALDDIEARQKRRNEQEELYLRFLQNEDKLLARRASDARMRWAMSGAAALPALSGPYSGASGMFTPGSPAEPGRPLGPWWPGPLAIPPGFGDELWGEGADARDRDLTERMEREMEEARARLDALADRIAAPFHDAFASAVVDGFRTGFDNLRDIGQSLLSSWIGMLSQAVSQRAFGGVFEAIAGGLGGGSTVVNTVFSPAAAVAQGIDTSPALQSTINAIGSDVRTLEQYRGG